MANDSVRAISTKHLDEVRSATNWSLGFVFVATTLTLQGSESFAILGLNLSRSAAFVCISLIYSALCVGALVHFERIGQHLQKLSTDQVDAEMESLTAHEWIFNPFVLYQVRHPGYWGFSGLIAFFWLGLTNLFLFAVSGRLFGPEPVGESRDSLDTLLIIVNGWVYALPLGVIAIIGYGVMRVVQSIPRIAADRLESSAPRRAEDLKAMTAGLHKAADAGIAAGGFLLLVILVLAGIYARFGSSANILAL